MARPVEPPPLEGPVRFGPYTLVRRIGAGGMGEVFLAREEGPRRACVVKKVLPQLMESPQFVGRFRDEARVVVRLAHPNIARVYAMGEVEGQLYLSMEYVRGKTLSRLSYRLRQLARMMPLGIVLHLGERLCEGLAYAHDATDAEGHPLHLVHRDLSPANVCISYAGEVKIIDFGAAQSTLKEQQTAPRVVIGNLTYMSPEQARKRFVDRRADVYAVGVLLWELFAWKPLSQRGDPVERWRRAAYPQWEPAGKHRQGLPSSIEAFLAKALTSEPAQRFPDAAAMGAELARLKAKLAPGVGDAALGKLLALVFPREKKAEEALLEELLREEAKRTNTEPQLVATLAPPTALAFEHNAIYTPDDFVPSERVQVGPAPTADDDETIRERGGVARSGGDATIRERTGIGDDEPTHAMGRPGRGDEVPTLRGGRTGVSGIEPSRLGGSAGPGDDEPTRARGRPGRADEAPTLRGGRTGTLDIAPVRVGGSASLGDDEPTHASGKPGRGDDLPTLREGGAGPGDDEATHASGRPALGDDVPTLRRGGVGSGDDEPTHASRKPELVDDIPTLRGGSASPSDAELMHARGNPRLGDEVPTLRRGSTGPGDDEPTHAVGRPGRGADEPTPTQGTRGPGDEEPTRTETDGRRLGHAGPDTEPMRGMGRTGGPGDDEPTLAMRGPIPPTPSRSDSAQGEGWRLADEDEPTAVAVPPRVVTADPSITLPFDAEAIESRTAQYGVDTGAPRAAPQPPKAKPSIEATEALDAAKVLVAIEQQAHAARASPPRSEDTVTPAMPSTHPRRAPRETQVGFGIDISQTVATQAIEARRLELVRAITGEDEAPTVEPERSSGGWLQAPRLGLALALFVGAALVGLLVVWMTVWR
ncbi:protein kinase [Myxococcus sp. K38C18041901]|uniref:serine/threonine protein kinase n=1 Tax=Myxococcus guangdongensis TaxID=2906760 RepID=UPI0020A7214F|nr:serine/threonine protein kinase [Myxococcus guangdongensis]MCP3062982.1 protein kinase [Myxococcus guangdongensis]